MGQGMLAITIKDMTIHHKAQINALNQGELAMLMATLDIIKEKISELYKKGLVWRKEK
jgi:hypothetical protein